jgi:hypothetical protein
LKAAEALGCNYSHLRRVVIGQRESKSLMARYLALNGSAPMDKPQPQNTTYPPPIELAAAQNLCPFFFNTLATLGLDVVIVRFKSDKGSAPYQDAGIVRDLEAALVSIHAGQFDSSFFALGAEYHFFHVAKPDLGRAMQTLKDVLQKRELLHITTLLHAETHNDLREWYPGNTAALIQTDPQA